MNNPYHPPSSNITLHDEPPPTKRGWKVFFWFFLTAEILSTYWLFMDDSIVTSEMIGEIVIYGMILLGMFGFAYDKKIFIRQYWWGVIPLGLTYDIYSLYTGDWGHIATSEELVFTLGMLVIVVGPLLFFQYLALYNYGFKSRNIWR